MWNTWKTMPSWCVTLPAQVDNCFEGKPLYLGKGLCLTRSAWSDLFARCRKASSTSRWRCYLLGSIYLTERAAGWRLTERMLAQQKKNDLCKATKLQLPDSTAQGLGGQPQTPWKVTNSDGKTASPIFPINTGSKRPLKCLYRAPNACGSKSESKILPMRAKRKMRWANSIINVDFIFRLAFPLWKHRRRQFKPLAQAWP